MKGRAANLFRGKGPKPNIDVAKHSKLFKAGKILGKVSTGISVISWLGDTDSMLKGEMSVERWGYNTASTFIPLIAAAYLGGPAGLLIAGGFVLGQAMYDNWDNIPGNIENIKSELKKGLNPNEYIYRLGR